jgi:hypothetical protein
MKIAMMKSYTKSLNESCSNTEKSTDRGKTQTEMAEI